MQHCLGFGCSAYNTTSNNCIDDCVFAPSSIKIISTYMGLGSVAMFASMLLTWLCHSTELGHLESVASVVCMNCKKW